MYGLSMTALCPVMDRSRVGLHPISEISDQDVFFLSFSFSTLKWLRLESVEKTTRFFSSERDKFSLE